MNIHKSSQQQGFTILELVIVLGIIGVLAGGAITLMKGFGDTAKIQRTDNDIRNAIIPALDSYKLIGKMYPSTDQGLKALVKKPASQPVPQRHSPIKAVPIDPWGNEYGYENNGGVIRVFSKGQDGKLGTEDDIASDD